VIYYTSCVEPTIKKIDIPGLSINARVWGPEDGKRILALHGWLDNAASFDRLAPLLQDYHIVAIDLPGHGFSDYLPLSGHYNTFDRAMQVVEVADALGWESFALLGHSLGGMVSNVVPIIIPDRITHVGMIDSIWHASAFASDVADMFKNYYASTLNERKNHTVYDSLEQAAEMRVNVAKLMPVSFEGALVLAEGGMKREQEGYIWTFDLRLLRPHYGYNSLEMKMDVSNAIQQPVCIIIAENSFFGYGDQSELLNKAYHHITHPIVPGYHHVHLDNPEPCAAILKAFYDKA